MSILKISPALIAESVDHLRASKQRERVILWLGERGSDDIRVRKVFLPIQVTAADYFRIPEAGMDALFALLRKERLFVAAQVHTHPHDAFHSPADDRWAIVRHEGALSLVVPDFCQHTTTTTFVADAKAFQLDGNDTFVEVEPSSAYVVLE
ncbi:MAG: Mov34/MPN/PAD-1 family protein [Kofleriaceae bacterium]